MTAITLPRAKRTFETKWNESKAAPFTKKYARQKKNMNNKSVFDKLIQKNGKKLLHHFFKVLTRKLTKHTFTFTATFRWIETEKATSKQSRTIKQILSRG